MTLSAPILLAETPPKYDATIIIIPNMAVVYPTWFMENLCLSIKNNGVHVRIPVNMDNDVTLNAVKSKSLLLITLGTLWSLERDLTLGIYSLLSLRNKKFNSAANKVRKETNPRLFRQPYIETDIDIEISVMKSATPGAHT